MKLLITKLADLRPDSCKLSSAVHIHAMIPNKYMNNTFKRNVKTYQSH